MAGLYSLDGVLRNVIHDDGGHGDHGELERGRGHGEVQGVQVSVTMLSEQRLVVKHSGASHAAVIVLAAGRRAARRL